MASPTDQDVIKAFTDGALCGVCEYHDTELDALGQSHPVCLVLNNCLNNDYCVGAEYNCAGGDEVEDDGFVTLHPSFEEL